MVKNIKVSVVIPTLNEEKYLGSLLECLEVQTFKNFDVVVSDANSKDSTRDIAKQFNVKIVDGGRIAYGRNVGARAGKGELILFLDADVKFGPKFLENCLKSFEELNAEVACCYFAMKGFSWGMKVVYQIWNDGKKLRENTWHPDGEGQCLWVKREVFERINGFKEDIRIGEDVDFIHRAVKEGYRYRVLPVKFQPSTRRYRKFGTFRVFVGTLISGLGLILGVRRGGKVYEKVYGGWGEHSKA